MISSLTKLKLFVGSLSRSHEDSDSSGSSDAGQRAGKRQPTRNDTEGEADESEEETDEDQLGHPASGSRTLQRPAQSQTQSTLGRPQSSMSTQRYRTPMGGSMVMSPPPPMPPLLPGVGGPHRASSMSMSPHQQLQFQQSQGFPLVQPQPYTARYMSPSMYAQGQGPAALHASLQGGVPNVQPLPPFETPSAFSGPSPTSSLPIDISSATMGSTSVSASGASPYTNVHHPLPYPASMHPAHPAYTQQTSTSSQGMLASPAGPVAGLGLNNARSPLERAVEGVQAHLAALQERMETLEARSGGTPYQSHSSIHGQISPLRRSPFGSYRGPGGGEDRSWWMKLAEFDPDYFSREHMGLWSVALVPLARLTRFLMRIVAFLLVRRNRDRSAGLPGVLGGYAEGMSPGLVVLRRLLLDASFVLCMAFAGRAAWRRSGIRRREVMRALAGVWGALVGTGAPARTLVDRGV